MSDPYGGGADPVAGDDQRPDPTLPPAQPAQPLAQQPAHPPYQSPQQHPYQAPYQQPYGQVYGVPPAGVTPPGHYGAQPYAAYPPQAYAQPGFGPPGYGLRDPDRRPGTVLAAGIVTLVMSGMVLLFAGLMMLLLIATGEDFFDGYFDASDRDAVVAALVIVLAVLVLWSAAAIALAILVLRRLNWARITLVVSSAVTIAVSALSMLGGGYGAVLTLFGAIAVIVLLFTGGAGDWFRGRHDVDPTVQAY